MILDSPKGAGSPHDGGGSAPLSLEKFNGRLHRFDCPSCGGRIKIPLMLGNRHNTMPIPWPHYRGDGRKACRNVVIPGPPHRIVTIPPSQSIESYMQRFMAAS